MNELIGSDHEHRARALTTPRRKRGPIRWIANDLHPSRANSARNSHGALAGCEPGDADVGQRILGEDDGIELHQREYLYMHDAMHASGSAVAIK